MARDSQAALVALHRFGFGARGGASGDFVNAASDPRGFVKAELNRPNGGLLEVPGPAVDGGARQGRVRLSVRDSAGARCGLQIIRQTVRTTSGDGRPVAARCRGTTAKSFARRHRDGDGAGEAACEAAGKSRCGHGACFSYIARDDAARRAKAAAATAQYHSKDVSRRGAGAAAARRHRRLRLRRAACRVLVQSFLHLRQQGRGGADVGGLVRARSDQASCARAFR